MASRLARAAGCKVRRSQSDGSSEGSGGSEGGSEDDDNNNAGYGEGSGDNFGIEGVPTTLPDILSFVMGKINVYASGEARELHGSIRSFLRVATARETSVPHTWPVVDIAGEMHASLQQRIDTGDVAAVQGSGMLHQLVQADDAAVAARLAALAAAKEAASLKRKGETAGLPQRADRADAMLQNAFHA